MTHDPAMDAEQVLKDTRSLRRMAGELVADPHLADDVAQEAFLGVHRSRGVVVESRGAWLGSVVRNAARMFARGASRRREREERAARPDVAPSTAEILEREELRRTVVEAVVALDEPYRTTLILRYLEDQSIGAVAAKLGVAKETVRTRCRRGLELLRPKLARGFGGAAGTGRALALLGAPVGALRIRTAGQVASPVKHAARTSLVPGSVLATLMKLKLALAVVIAAVTIVLFSQVDSGGRAGDGGDRAQDATAERTDLVAITDEEATREEIAVSDTDVAAPVQEEEEVTAPTAAATSGSLRVAVSWPDGSPATGVAVLFRRRSSTATTVESRPPFYETEWVLTSDDGIAQVTDRAPGKFRVACDRGGEVEAEVVAGEVTEQELEIEGGYDVVGLVVDADDRPVSGATVYCLSWRDDWTGARKIARSDAQGRFKVRAIGEERSLAAAAPSHGPSEVVDLEVRAGIAGDESQRDEPEGTAEPSKLDVTLKLTRDGAELSGRVLAAEGTPVRGAIVAVAIPRAHYDSMMIRGFREQWRARTAITDADGAFRLEGLASGERTVHAFHPDWPTWTTTVELDPRLPKTIEARFEAPAWIHGVVTLSDGGPAAAADVLVLDEPFDDPFPKQGPTELGSPIRRPRTQANRDGTFEIGPLAAGAVHLHASLGTSFLTPYVHGVKPEYMGTHQETLEVAPGDRIEWNPKLSFGASFVGRVQYADGSPIKDAFVTADIGDFNGSSVTTDDDGRFRIPNLDPVPHRLHFQLPFDAPPEATAEVLYDVVPSDDEHVLTADYSPTAVQKERGTIVFRLADDSGMTEYAAPEAVAPVIAHQDRSAWTYLDERKDGSFTTKIRAGHYRVSMRTDSATLWMGEVFEVTPGATVDLGTLRPLLPGDVRVRVTRPEGATGELRVRARVRGYLHGPRGKIPEGESECTLEAVTAGAVTLELTGNGVATETFDVDVVSGDTIVANLTPKHGVPLTIETDLARRRGFRRVVVQVFDEDGREVAKDKDHERHVLDWPITTTAWLAPGTYRAVVETADGQRLDETFELKDSEAPQTRRVVAR